MTSQQKDIKLETVPQPKEGCEVDRNWLDLPLEVTFNILYRIGLVDILLNAQKVCTAWHEICKDPAMWRVIYMDAWSYKNPDLADSICENAIDRSQGQLVDISIVNFGINGLLKYMANRSSQLKRLTIARSVDYEFGTWEESLKKLPLLEEINLYKVDISEEGVEEGIEAAARYCPMLKTLKVNQDDFTLEDYYSDDDYYPGPTSSDRISMAIGKSLHELRHLELIGSTMSNEGLEVILDGCPHLELLDLRACWFINLNGDLGRRCLQQIKCVKLPKDNLNGCQYIYKRICVASESEGGSDYESSEPESFGEFDVEYEGESYEESGDHSEGESCERNGKMFFLKRCGCCPQEQPIAVYFIN